MSSTWKVGSTDGVIVQVPATGASVPYRHDQPPVYVASGSTTPFGSTTFLTMENELRTRTIGLFAWKTISG